MTNDIQIIDNEDIQSKIYTIRGLQVMMDRDLSELYGVENRRLNEQVKRNIDRFPSEFMFQLSKDELENWKSQFATSNKELMGLRKMPYVFTEQGVSMLSAVLKSKTAINMSIKIINSFVNMRKLINSNDFYIQQLKLLEKRQLTHEIKSDEKFDKIFDVLDSKNIQDNTNGIFFNDQMYDAYSFISDLLRKATKSIVLIDNYVDDTTLTLFSKFPNIKVSIYTNTQTKQLKLDLAKYNTQYNNVTIKTFKDSHDRFLILDDKDVYLVGASLKDLGKKWFGFSKLDISSIETILKKLP